MSLPSPLCTKQLGLRDPTTTLLIQKVLQGEGAYGQASVRYTLPITLPVLMKLVDSLAHICDSYWDRSLYRCMYLLAFFAFLRVGKIATSSSAETNTLTLLPSKAYLPRISMPKCLTRLWSLAHVKFWLKRWMHLCIAFLAFWTPSCQSLNVCASCALFSHRCSITLCCQSTKMTHYTDSEVGTWTVQTHKLIAIKSPFLNLCIALDEYMALPWQRHAVVPKYCLNFLRGG